MTLIISGFADEISDDLDEQIKVVKSHGMNHICLRGVDGKNIGDYSVDDFKTAILPRLEKEQIKVSCIGSPIGKIFIDDEEGFKKQLVSLENLCQIAQLLSCKYMRIFSFYIEEGKVFDAYLEPVVDKLKQFVEIASRYDVILLHENEKDIFGDTISRCKALFKAVNDSHFKAIFDFANFVQCGENTLEAYAELKEDIVEFHIKDASYDVSYNVLAGTGDGNIPHILKDAIAKGYSGFLTLEPHLAMFGSLKDLELGDAKEVVNTGADITGEQGYGMQYEALLQILDK